MSAKKTQKQKAFTSFRIIGKKAQDLISRAGKLRKTEPTKEVPLAFIEKETAQPPVFVAFSLGSIAKSTVTIIGILISSWALYQIIDTVLLLVLAFFVAAVIDPTVRMLEKWGIPRGIAILIHYCLLLFIIVFLLISLIPIIAEQIQNIALLLANYVDAFRQNPSISIPFLNNDLNARVTELVSTLIDKLSIGQFSATLNNLGQSMSQVAQTWALFAARIAGSVAQFFIKLIIVLVLAFFIQIEKEKMRSWFASFFPNKYRHYMDDKGEAVQEKIGQWARGQALLGFSIGLLVFVALNILGMTEYAVTLAALAALTEFIPYIGPFIAAVPAVLIALSQGGPVWALIVVGVYYVIQWCENNLLVPLIMKRAVGISPIAVMCAMLIGVSFPTIIHPILGLLLAVPTTTIITIFLEDWRQMRQNRH